MASRLPVFLACALLAGAAHCAELGEARIASYLGQPLAAEIELTLLDAPAAPVQVRLAHPNVYRGANIGMPQVLHSLTMTVMQRDGRQFLHLASQAPVESGNLHVFLELLDGSQRHVRLVTLSMAPPPAPVPAAAAAPAPAARPAPAVPAGPALAPEVAAPEPVAARARPRPAPQPPRRSVPGPVPQASPRPEAGPAPVPAAAPVTLAPAAPVAAVCAPAAGGDRATVCAALDYKASQLRERIGELEGKVRVLQVALGASPATAGEPPPAATARLAPARKRPPPEPQAQAGAPWGWIAGGGAALLALAGAALVLLRRRRGAAPLAIRVPTPAALLARLRQRLARGHKGAGAAQP